MVCHRADEARPQRHANPISGVEPFTIAGAAVLETGVVRALHGTVTRGRTPSEARQGLCQVGDCNAFNESTALHRKFARRGKDACESTHVDGDERRFTRDGARRCDLESLLGLSEHALWGRICQSAPGGVLGVGSQRSRALSLSLTRIDVLRADRLKRVAGEEAAAGVLHGAEPVSGDRVHDVRFRCCVRLFHRHAAIHCATNIVPTACEAVGPMTV